jgi:hypothetical protein
MSRLTARPHDIEVIADRCESVKRKRPSGIVLLALLNLVNGLYIGFDHFQRLFQVYSTSRGPVIMSDDYAINLVEQSLIVLIAIGSAVGLMIGSKFGWGLACFHWIWRLCREAIVPLGVNLVLGSASAPAQTPIDLPGTYLVIGALMYYLCRRNVLEYFNLSDCRKVLALISIFLLATILQLGFTGLENMLSPSNEELKELFAAPDSTVLFHIPPRQL